MSKLSKVVIGVLLSVLAISLIGYFTLRYLVTKSFPDVDGELTVVGLEHRVKILRDEYGVPHIFAENEHDLFFAQGYVHAQDRLWQMDLSRRAGEGRLSEILGGKTVAFDKLLRTIGFKNIAERLYRQISPDSKRILEAYSAGVNAFIASHRGKYPIEFDMLNYTPEEWTPVASLMIVRLMAWELNLSWYVDVVLGEIVTKFGEERAGEIFPTYPENAPVIVRKESISYRTDALREMIRTDRAIREFLGTTGTHIGSNAWAVAPHRSASGKAMIANDPHLGLSNPAKWYEIHLCGGPMNVAGVSLPGTPLVVIGHSPSVAWGLTNVMADDADFYIEKTDSLHPDQYLFEGEWKPVIVSLDTIPVKDSASAIVTIRATHHGPVINAIHPAGAFSTEPMIAMRWTGFEMSDELLAIYRINTSQSWNEFLDGVKEFAVPGQNFVYADNLGNIGYHPGVRLPVRSHQNPTLPVPGWTGTDEWRGFVPFDQLPSLYNPPQGYIATANNKLTNGDFPYHISNLWEPPSRIQRIDELLTKREKNTVKDFQQIQMDQFSYYAKDVIAYILHAYDTVRVSEKDVETSLRYFRNWHFQCTKEDVTTTLFHVFLQHFFQNVFEKKMGTEVFHQYIFLANIPYRVSLTLLNNPASWWFDDTTTAVQETRDDVIRKSLSDAIHDLHRRFTGDIKTWHWGDLHTLTLKHPFGSVKPLDVLFNIGPMNIGGSGTTVDNGEYSFVHPYAITLGPSMRQITDFAEPDNSLSVIPSGQSGQPLHEHYNDQTQLWLNGQYHRMPIHESEVLRFARHTLILTPPHE